MPWVWTGRVRAWPVLMGLVLPLEAAGLGSVPRGAPFADPLPDAGMWERLGDRALDLGGVLPRGACGDQEPGPDRRSAVAEGLPGTGVPGDAGFHDVRARAWLAPGPGRDTVAFPGLGPASSPYLASAGVLVLSGGLTVAVLRHRRRRRLLWLLDQRRVLAERSSLAKSRFLATFGHEVRTPMTGVLGMSELLLETALDPRQRRYVESIHAAGGHLVRLVNDALDLARIEAGKLHVACEAFDVRGLVRELAALMAPLAARRGLDFHCRVEDSVPRRVLGDAVRVRQVLLNLLGNAVKFTERGHVALRVAWRPGTGVRFEVADTGPGLDAAQQARLFRRFEQVGSGNAAAGAGSGLGLAISRELAEAMGGRIEVDSVPGRGTCFTIELPLPEAAVPAGQVTASGSRPSPAGSGTGP